MFSIYAIKKLVYLFWEKKDLHSYPYPIQNQFHPDYRSKCSIQTINILEEHVVGHLCTNFNKNTQSSHYTTFKKINWTMLRNSVHQI